MLLKLYNKYEKYDVDKALKRKGKQMKDKLINLKNKAVGVITNNKRVSIIIAVALIVIIIAVILISSRTKIGNTSGNLNNSGFSVKDGGWIYYLGLKDNNTDGIYKIKSNSDKKEKVSSDYGLYLNKVGNYIYYLDRTSGNRDIVKMKMNGENKEVIIKDVDTEKITVVDNWIYYFKDSKFYRAKTNGEGKQILSKKTVESYEVVDKWIYYSYIDDSKYTIAKMRTNGEDVTKIDNDASRLFFVDNNNIYYIYENEDENEFEYNYELYKIKTNGKDKNKVADIGKKIQFNGINFDGDRIYYTKVNEDNDILSIYSMKINGKDETKIVDIKGDSTIINVHGDWVYYTDQNDNGDSDMFRIKTNGKDKQSISM